MKRRELLALAAAAPLGPAWLRRSCARCLRDINGPAFPVAELQVEGTTISLVWCPDCARRTHDDILENLRASFGAAT